MEKQSIVEMERQNIINSVKIDIVKRLLDLSEVLSYEAKTLYSEGKISIKELKGITDTLSAYVGLMNEINNEVVE